LNSDSARIVVYKDYLLVEGTDGNQVGLWKVSLAYNNCSETETPTSPPSVLTSLEPTSDPSLVPSSGPTNYPTIYPSSTPSVPPTVEPARSQGHTFAGFVAYTLTVICLVSLSC
jgi:hypothetical protein